MTDSAKTAVATDPRPTIGEERAQLFEIDQSTRVPALIFIGTAIAWLFIGSIFALIASFKMHTPGFLADHEWLTFGRIRTAHLNAVVYGWSVNAAVAVGFWIMARLSRALLRHGGILYVSGAFWNIGVFIGIVGILRGDMESVEWLEFPRYVTPLLFVSWILIGVWTVLTFRYRESGETYVSQWFILAAVFCFPWIYSVAQIMLIWQPTIGIVQPLTNWWYAHNLYGLWFTPMGLAAAYYFIPKVIGRPIRSYHLAVIGFWSLVFFYSWAGMHHLIGGPVPVWVQSTGVVASMMMLIPVFVTAINLHMTVAGAFSTVWNSPTLRFIVFGGVNFTIVTLIGTAVAFRSVSQVTQFTHFSIAHSHHGMYAFFSMVMFGSIYFMLPRLLRKEWPSSFLIVVHFWAASGGIVLYVVALSIGGWIQGLQMLDATGHPEFLTIVQNTLPWLFSRSVAGVIILVGHAAFAINFFWMLLKPRSEADSAPTLFQPPQTLKTTTT